MLTRIIFILAAAGFALAVYVVFQGQRTVVAAAPAAMPPLSPFQHHVAGAGLIEPAFEAVSIGVPVSGLILAVPAKVGSVVSVGDPLLVLDDRTALAAAASARAEAAAAHADAKAAEARAAASASEVAAAEAEVTRLKASPRSEEVAIRASVVAAAEVAAADARDQYATWKNIPDERAVPREQLERRRFAAELAAAAVVKARAELALTEAGAWAADIAVAEQRVVAAKATATAARELAAAAAAKAGAADAHAAAVEVELKRLTITAPKDATVLRVSARPGEYAVAGFNASPLVVLGDTREMHIRVDIDENDAWRVKAGAKARAAARGNSDLAVDLTFVRIEPLVVPKRNLTGDSAERVDTRVLQVVFAFKPDPKLPLFVGQQMDVFIEEGGATATAP